MGPPPWLCSTSGAQPCLASVRCLAHREPKAIWSACLCPPAAIEAHEPATPRAFHPTPSPPCHDHDNKTQHFFAQLLRPLNDLCCGLGLLGSRWIRLARPSCSLLSSLQGLLPLRIAVCCAPPIHINRQLATLYYNLVAAANARRLPCRCSGISSSLSRAIRSCSSNGSQLLHAEGRHDPRRCCLLCSMPSRRGGRRWQRLSRRGPRRASTTIFCHLRLAPPGQSHL